MSKMASLEDSSGRSSKAPTPERIVRWSKEDRGRMWDVMREKTGL